jgi:multidrug efflux system outer membrane protein
VERTAVQLRGNRAVTTVALIRALGGGWDVGRIDSNTVAMQ